MAATKRPNGVENFEKFCEGRGENNWILEVNGKQFPPGTDWKVKSRFGSVEAAVVVDKEGRPLFDRPSYSEAPGVSIVAWGRDAVTGEVKIAVIHQPRPHADDPEDRSSTEEMVFGQLPMGFMDKLIGKEEMEHFTDAAKRETAEEAGASVVLAIEVPPYPYQNACPTFLRSWVDLCFVQVDLQKIGEGKKDATEPIYKAEYISVKELIKRVGAGKADGAAYRMGISNALWFIFFCCHPDLWPDIYR